eukprot:748005-Hanusia_phi.AAC.3
MIALSKQKSGREAEAAWKWMMQAALEGHKEAQFRVGWKFEIESTRSQDSQSKKGDRKQIVANCSQTESADRSGNEQR